MNAELAFRAMGTECRVLVWSPAAAEDLAILGKQRVEILEQAWSRFRVSSELSQLNSDGHTSHASEDLLVLVQAMKDAWVVTDGLFDPTVLPALNAWGYDRNFTDLPTSFAADIPQLHTPGLGDVVIDGTTITLPTGVNLDPGAIGKGLAADIVANELFAAGAHGVLVDLGGDISWRGLPDAEYWHLIVRDERTATDRWEIFTADAGGLATSTTRTRRWAEGRHHVIDPNTGAPSTHPSVQATVLAPRAVFAEVIATAALLTDNPTELFTRTDTAGLVLSDNDEHVAPHFLSLPLHQVS